MSGAGAGGSPSHLAPASGARAWPEDARLGDPNSLPLLCAAVRTEGLATTVRNPLGEVLFEADEQDEADALAYLLSRLDGRTPREALAGSEGVSECDAPRVLWSLEEARLAVDARQFWRMAYQFAANPPAVGPPMAPDDAYAIDPWAISGADVAVPAPLAGAIADTAARRHSPDLGSSVVPDPRSTASVGLRAFCDALRRRAGMRSPVASAGDMRPLHAAFFWRKTDRTWMSTIVDHDRDVRTRCRPVGARELYAAFFATDDWIGASLDAGATVAVVLADSIRICGKYGSRGWNYALIESGAVLQHATLLAIEHNHQVRPIGGFAEAPMQLLLESPALLPTVAALVLPDCRE